MSHKCHYVEIRPTKRQRKIFDDHIKCSAICYNMALEVCRDFSHAYHENGDRMFLSRGEIGRICTIHRNSPPFDKFFDQFDGVTCHSAVTNQWKAINNFRKAIKRGDHKWGFPKRKDINKHDSFCFKTSSSHVGELTDKGNIVRVPAKLGNRIKTREIIRWDEQPKQLTVRRVNTGKKTKYFLSYRVNAEPLIKYSEPRDDIAGIDLGMNGHTVSFGSDRPTVKLGSKIKSIGRKYMRRIGKRQKSTKRKQRGGRSPSKKKLERMVEGSRNYKKHQRLIDNHSKTQSNRYKKAVRKNTQKLYYRWNNEKNDIIEKETTWLVRRAKVIAIQEDPIEAMKAKTKSADGKTKKKPTSAKSIIQVVPRRYIERIKQKLDDTGGIYVPVSSKEATTKTCNFCGHKNSKETVNGKSGFDLKRTFICEGCGRRIRRDPNASHNIQEFAVKAASLISGSQEKSLG